MVHHERGRFDRQDAKKVVGRGRVFPNLGRSWVGQASLRPPCSALGSSPWKMISTGNTKIHKKLPLRFFRRIPKAFATPLCFVAVAIAPASWRIRLLGTPQVQDSEKQARRMLCFFHPFSSQGLQRSESYERHTSGKSRFLQDVFGADQLPGNALLRFAAIC